MPPGTANCDTAWPAEAAEYRQNRQGPRETALPLERPLDLAVCLELAEGINSPDSRRNPSNNRDLENQAEQTCDGTANREKGKPGENQGDQQSQGASLRRWLGAVPSLASRPAGAHRRNSQGAKFAVASGPNIWLAEARP